MGAGGEAVAIHLAVLADVTDSGGQRLWGVLAYDGHGRRHLHELTSPPPPGRLQHLIEPAGPCQLQLPLADGLPAATSGGLSWQSWVLPTIPISLRTLPPERLAAAFADELAGEVGS